MITTRKGRRRARVMAVGRTSTTDEPDRARILNQLVDSARLFTVGWADPHGEAWLRRQLEGLGR